VRDEVSLEQSKLRADVAVVRAYGQAHPEAWVDLRYENEPTVRIVALFAGDDPLSHEEALRRLVSHPDQLEVRPSPWARVRLEEIRAGIHEMATSSEPGLFSGWGIGCGRVNVRLRADGERVATRLREQYGDAVDVTLGFLHFPDCAFPDSRWPLTADPAGPGALPLPEELHASVDEELEVKSGADLGSRIRLVNKGDADVVATTNGRLTARVVDPETNEVVGAFSGAQTLPLVRFRAPAGGSVEIPILIGTASTVPPLGYAVPPGRWAVEIVVPLEAPGPYRAPLVPLRVVA
jgi:hypothetical protein